MTNKITGIVVAFFALVIPIASCPAVEFSSPQKAQELASSFRDVEAIQFYFLSRTEEWNYTTDEIVRNSSIRVHRSCGFNCHNFMDPVVAHFRNARATKCIPGQQNALIRGKSGHDLIYSHGGRRIRYGNQCFVSERGIREVVAGTSMLFTTARPLTSRR